MSDLVRRPGIQSLAVQTELQDLWSAARSIEGRSIKANTRAAYDRVWRRFCMWCKARQLSALPAEPSTVEAYAMAAVQHGIPSAQGDPGKPISKRTLDVHLSAIQLTHSIFAANVPDPVRAIPQRVLAGIAHEYNQPPKKKTWLSEDQLTAAIEVMPKNRKGLRDRAILLVAFTSGGRRRSEVVAMRMEHLRHDRAGYLWALPDTKTSKPGEAFVTSIPRLGGTTCPVEALEAWLDAADITSGYVFRAVDRKGVVGPDVDPPKLALQPAAVAEVVKAAAARLGLDPTSFGGHSLRSGFMTDMARKGVALDVSMGRSGHRSVQTAMGYHQQGRLLSEDDPVRLALRRKS